MPLDERLVSLMEEALEDTIRVALKRLTPRQLPWKPDERTVHLMAKAATAVYEAAAERETDEGR